MAEERETISGFDIEKRELTQEEKTSILLSSELEISTMMQVKTF